MPAADVVYATLFRRLFFSPRTLLMQRYAERYSVYYAIISFLMHLPLHDNAFRCLFSI